MAEPWPDEIEVELTGIAQGGDAVGRWEGRPVFVAGALPGEHARVRLRDRQTSFARGDAVEILEAVPERVASRCPLETTCGAGSWRWVEYEAQLRFKAAILQDQLRHLGGIDVEVHAVHRMEISDTPPGAVVSQAPGWGYRTTAELHVSHGKVGYFAPNSRRIVDIARCCLHHPAINDALAALRPLLRPDLPVRAITLRCAPAGREVLAVLDGERPPKDLAPAWMRAFPPLVGVLGRHRSRLTTLAGKDHLVQELANCRWYVGAGSFFQVNDRQTERMIRRVIELADVRPDERLLDLFCGVGTFAIPLARRGARVTGVESFAPAIEDARRSAEMNLVAERTEWRAGVVEEILSSLPGPYDGAILDPPRRGCDPAALEHLRRLAPARIVYVACHPGTLARDCKILVAGGYVVERAEVVDLFPQTHHVESIVLLRRK